MRKRLMTLAAALCLGLVFMVGTALADGGAVEDVIIEADGVTIEALADENTACTLIAALYDEDGRMVDVKPQDIGAGEDWQGKLTWTARQSGVNRVKVFLVDSKTSEPVSRPCVLKVSEDGESGSAAGQDFAVLLAWAQDTFGTQAKLLFADGTKKVVDLDSNYGNVYNLMIGELYTYRTNADGEYQIDPAPMDGASSGYDYTRQGGTVQPQSDTNGNAGYIDGYEIADNAVIFVRYDYNGSYKVITGTNLCAMTAGDFACNYVLATDSAADAGKVALAYVTANRSSVIGGTRQNTATESGFAVLLAWNRGAFSEQAKLLFADGTRKVVDLDPNYGNVYNLMIGELYTYRTNADGEYQLDPAPMDGASSGYDYTRQGGTVQPQSDTNGNAGYIDGYEIADDAVIFVQYSSGGGGGTAAAHLAQYDDGTLRYITITGRDLRTMPAADFTCNYVLGTGRAGAGTVEIAYVSTSRTEITGADPGSSVTDQGCAALIAWSGGGMSDQAKLLFADGSKKVVDLDSSVYYQDGYVSAYELRTEQIYSCEVNGDGEYRLKELTGYDVIQSYGSIQAQSDTNANAGNIDGREIADDAVIFLQYGPSSYKVITGAELRTMESKELGAMYYAANDKVSLAFVAQGGGGGSPAPRPRQSDIHYGYIAGGVVMAKNANNETVYQIELWTGQDVRTYETVSANEISADGLVKGNAVSYKVNNNGEITEIVGYASPDNMVAVTDISSSELWIDGTPTPLDPDAEVMVVDMDDRYGIEIGSIQSISAAEQAADGSYIPNAMVFYDDDGEVAVIVYDVNNGRNL